MKLPGSRLLWSISIPLLFAEVSEIVIHVTDTLFLSRVGITELGAVGLADAISDIVLVLALGLVDGIQILTARQLGRGRPRQAIRLFNLGLLVTVGLSAVLALLLWLNIGVFTEWIVESESVGLAVDEFLRIGLIDMPFTVACFAYSALLVGFGRTQVLIPATILLTATNAVLGYVFIFGKFGFAPMGIRGAALASVIAELITFAYMTWYLWTRLGGRRYGIFRFGGFTWRRLGRLLRVSGPVSIQGQVEALRWFLFFLILERVGTVALAVANVVSVCYSVFRIPTEAFGETACSMVSRLIGRERPDRIGRVIRQSIMAAGLVTLPVVLAGLIVPEWILSAFALEEGLLQAGAASLRVVALSMLIVIPAEMWLTAVVGTGDTPAALGIEIALTIVTVGACYLAAIPMAGSLALIWSSLTLGWFVTLIASYGWMRSGAWSRHGY